MRGSYASVTMLVWVLVISTLITISDCLPRASSALLDVSLSVADDIVQSQTHHAVTGKRAFYTDITEAKRESATEEETLAENWLQEYNQEAADIMNENEELSWAYETNINDENKKKMVESDVELAEWEQQKAEEANEFDWKQFQNDSLKRQFRFVTDIGTAAMKNETKLKEMETLVSEMKEIYSTGKVCLDGKDLEMEPDLTEIMATSRNYSRLLKVWQGWRDAVGRPLKPRYPQLVDYSNEAIHDLGYNDMGEYWRSYYESPTFQEDLENLLSELSPLYEQLHAYVRRRLKDKYGEDNFPPTGHIPAHLLGNMWAQRWGNIYDLVQPYPDRKAIDVTAAMERQNYTVRQMFETAEAFFTSLGFEPLLLSFWEKSVLEKPADRKIVCHASASDFYTTDDFRIKMCTSVNHEYLVIVHHEVGHIQYGMQYRRQPLEFRDGANPGFHEAVGDTISLSVDTPAHLRKISLLEEGEDNEKDEINFLLKMALEKVAYLPFAYLIDQWRWSVFSGDTTPDRYNDKWWKLRCRYQGISPPVSRCAEDFDPGAKFHIAKNTPYIRYFASLVLQFQFQQALCNAAGHTDELHRCDIYQNGDAGNLLRSMLEKGKSTPWPDVLEEMTGNRKMNASAILEYFSPLHDWLKKNNSNAGEYVGWPEVCPLRTDNCTW